MLPSMQGVRLGLVALTAAAILAACSDDKAPTTLSPQALSPALASLNSSDFQQCANGTSGTATCDWINSVLNPSKSSYAEGEAIPFRLAIHLTDAGGFKSGQPREVTFEYGFEKSSTPHFNYDFLAKYNTSETQANVCSGPPSPVAVFCTSGNINSTYAADHHSFTILPPTTTPPEVSSVFHINKTVAQARQAFVDDGGKAELDMWGGTITSMSEPVYTASGDDIVARVQIKFIANKADVLLAWGAHFARGADWGTGFGASGQSGSPFHIKMVTIDNTNAGALGNNVSGGVVVLPALSLSKSSTVTAVNAGENVNYTVTVSNGASGSTASGVTINDALPTAGTDWSIQSQSPANACTITGNPGAETLSCGPVSLAPGTSLTATVVSATTPASCPSLSNTATGAAGGGVTVTGSPSAPVVITVNCPTLGITKTPATQTKSAGEPFSWTVTLTNGGPGTAFAAKIDDPLPPVTGVTYSLGSSSPAAANCAVTAGKLTCGPLDLANGASITAVVNAATSPGTSCAANGFTNTATGKATGVTDVQASATVTLNCPSLSITKLPASQTKSAGEPFSWTVVLKNDGTGTAVAATIDDPLPPVTGVSYSLGSGSDATCSITNGTTLKCGPVSLAGGTTMTAVINATTTAGTSCSANGFTNTATGKATGVTDVQASAVTILQCPIIGIAKTPATQTKSAGEAFSWTITLSNTGTGTAFGAKIDDPLPPVTGVTYSLGSSSPAAANCAVTAGKLTCGPLDLAASGTITAVVNATTTAGTSCAANGFTNTATGKATGLSDVQASATVTLNCPSLSIAKTPTTQTVPSGDPFSWTVTLKNDGTGTAFGASINDPLPALTGVSYSLDSSSPAAANCAVTAGTLKCGPLDLAGGASITAVVKATTTKGTSCSASGILNTATGKASGVTDVQATATTILKCPNLSITKTPDPGDADYLVQAGHVATFTVKVTSTGNTAAENTALTDTLPGGLTWTADQGICSTSSLDNNGRQILKCPIGTLNSGASFTVKVSTTIPSTFVQDTPTASGSPITIDGNLDGANDWASLSATVFKCPLTSGGTGGINCDLDKPTGTSDDSFGQGTKEDTGIPSVVDGSIPNNKSDLQRFYFATERRVIGGLAHDFVYLAWERVQQPNGTTNMDFELNQLSQLTSNGKTPVRKAGDVLIKYDLSKGGGTLTLGFHRWVETGSPASVCEASSTVPCWGPVKMLSLSAGAVEGAANAIQVTDPIAPGPSRLLDPLTFGEAGIDLQAAGIFDPNACTNFGQAYLKSRSSDSFTSEIKDFIAPIPVSVGNCSAKLLNNTAWAVADGVSAIFDGGQIKVTP